MSNIFRVFLASPSDLADEREKFPKIVTQVNNLRSRGDHRLESVGWEGALPGPGRPQSIINEDVKKCDVFVMLLWKRWGSPPQKGKKKVKAKFSSGTEEEFSIAQSRYKRSKKGPYILLYFRSVPSDMITDPGKQLKKVLKFRSMIESSKKFLFHAYDTPDEWEDYLREHLSKWMDKRVFLPEFSAQPEERVVKMSPQSEKRMLKLQKHFNEKDRLLKTAQTKLRGEAIGYAVEAMRLIEKGSLTLAEEKFAKSIDLFEEPEVLNNFGRFLYQIGSLHRAEALFEQVLGKTRSGADQYQQARANINLGDVHETRGALSNAEESYQRALKLYRKLGRKDGIADAYRSLGDIYRTRDLNRAERVYKEALKIDKQLRRKVGQAKVYGALGVLYQIRRDVDKAREMHEKSLRVNRALGLKEGMASAYGNLGNVWAAKGSLSKAKQMFDRALVISQSLGRKEVVAKVYGNLGIIYGRQKDLDKAEEMHEKALKISKSIGAVESMANAYNNLGLIHKWRGNLKKAQEMVEKSLKINQTLGSKEGIAGGYENQAGIFEAKGNQAQAKNALIKAQRLYEELGAKKQIREIGTRLKALSKPASRRTPQAAKRRGKG